MFDELLISKSVRDFTGGGEAGFTIFRRNCLASPYLKFRKENFLRGVSEKFR